MIIEYSHYQGKKEQGFLKIFHTVVRASGEKAFDVWATPRTQSHENSQQQKAPSLQHQKVVN
jgi:hypothetical protein